MTWILALGFACTTDPAKVAPASTASVEKAAPEQDDTVNADPGGGGGPEALLPPTAMIVNPATGTKVASYFVPPTTGQAPYPTLVVIPGAKTRSDKSAGSPRYRPFSDSGIALWFFDQEGRGASEGVDDKGGANAQASLRAVLAYVAADPRVRKDGIGVLSLSAGILTAAGGLAGDATGARFLIDWEGPADRKYVAMCSDDPARQQSNAAMAAAWGPCDDETFWSAREADKVIGKLRIPYQRVQFQQDHVQSSHQHAIDMYEAAHRGGVPWIRINDEEPGKKIASDNDATWLANTPNVNFDLARYARELYKSNVGLSLADPGPDKGRRGR